ncbi:MAG: hypothetical protein M8353_00865 [ANME-2 cluster archaeon]|nr:hypothetical protein [ANME-2 cluster archaeon]
MKKILIIMILLLVCARGVSAQEVLSIDTSKSFVIIVDEGGKKYMLEEFTRPDQLSFLEGQQLEAHFFIRRTTSNPRDTYVLEMLTDLGNAEWQYEILGNITRFKTAKLTVWNTPREHSVSSFEVVLSGRVPKPAVRTEEPYFKDYIGEGPGFRSNELAVFTVFDGRDAITKVQVVGQYTFVSTNPDIERYMGEINTNLDTSSLPEDYADILEEQKEYIVTLSKTGHVGLALDLSRIYARTVKDLAGIAPGETGTSTITGLILGVLVAILLAVVTGVIGYKVGQGGEKVSDDVIDQMEKSYNTLKEHSEKLGHIDISSVPGAEQQAAELETVKRQVSLSTAGLKNILNRLR